MSNKTDSQSNERIEPPIDYFDLSYITPLLTSYTLDEEQHTPFHMGGGMKLATGAAQRSGHLARRLIFERFFKTLNSDLDTVTQYPSAMVANWFVNMYPRRPYNHIILGPPLGSMTYLSCVLDAPFLPLNYRMSVSHDERIDADNILEQSKRAKKVAEKIIKKDPLVELVAEYDPVHERLRVGNTSLMRYKYLKLPRAYEQFIRTRLAPGGTVILVESRTGWNQYSLADRLSMQVGPISGISDEEFLRGSKRLAEFRERYLGDPKAAWRLRLRTEVKPESRFGVSPQMRASIMNTCSSLGKPVLQLFSSDIYQLNNLVSSLYVRCARREGKRPTRFFIHSGLMLAPFECMQSLLLPLWVPDASLPSLNFAKEYVNSYPFPTDMSFLALEPSVTGSPDALQMKQWLELAGDRNRKVVYVGNSRKLFPYDMTTYFGFWKSIQAASRRIIETLDIRVNMDMLIEEAQNSRIYYNLHHHTQAPPNE